MCSLAQKDRHNFYYIFISEKIITLGSPVCIVNKNILFYENGKENIFELPSENQFAEKLEFLFLQQKSLTRIIDYIKPFTQKINTSKVIDTLLKYRKLALETTSDNENLYKIVVNKMNDEINDKKLTIKEELKKIKSIDFLHALKLEHEGKSFCQQIEEEIDARKNTEVFSNLLYKI